MGDTLRLCKYLSTPKYSHNGFSLQWGVFLESVITVVAKWCFFYHFFCVIYLAFYSDVKETSHLLILLPIWIHRFFFNKKVFLYYLSVFILMFQIKVHYWYWSCIVSGPFQSIKLRNFMLIPQMVSCNFSLSSQNLLEESVFLWKC